MMIDRWAWDEFWRDQPPGNACLRRAPPTFTGALDCHWRSIADRFVDRARVIDLGCGSGVVGDRLSASRPDLHVIGVDFADISRRSSGASIEIRGRIAIEELPFDEASLDGAVSQFGFEYCHVDRGAAEIARVLRPGSPFFLIVHHGQSPIITDNVPTDRALRQLLAPPMKRAFTHGDHAMVRAIVAAIPAIMRVDPTIQLLSSALIDRLGWCDERRAEAWDAMSEAMRPAIALSAALDRSAVSPQNLPHWLAPLNAHFTDVEARPFEVGGQPMAWAIEGRRMA